jgi:hypothetical protein
MKLTPADRNYINYFKNKLKNDLLLAYYDDNTHTYHIQTNYTDKRTSKEVFLKMSEDFLSDIKNQTQTYTYYLDCPNHFTESMNRIKHNIFKPYVSDSLILNTLLIIHNPNGSLMNEVCQKALAHKNLSLFLQCLSKKSVHYAKSTTYDNNFDATMNLLNHAIQAFPEQTEHIREVFIEHFKISLNTIDDATLIEKYKKVFDANTVPLLLKSLDKQPLDDLCLSTPTYELATCHISFKTLCASTLNVYQIREIAKYVEKNKVDFPNFYIISQNEEHAFLGVEKSTDKALEKVQHLLKNLISQNYQAGADMKNNYHILNEMILKTNLDATITSYDKEKSLKKISKI